MIRVPFTNVDWIKVGECFLNDDVDVMKDALATLACWRLRAGKRMPVAADISELVLRVLVADQETDAGWLASGNVRLLYCTVITRFVNYVNEICQEGTRLVPIQHAVKKFGVPGWVVDVRHAATHTHLPTLELLRSAVRFCRTWLWKHHWSLPIDQAVSVTARVPRKALLLGEKRMLVERIHDALLVYEKQRMKFMFKPKEAGSKTAEKNVEQSLVVLHRLIKKRMSLFLSVFLSEGHFVMTERQLTAARWKLEGGEAIPSRLQQFWKPVFEILLDEGGLPRLLRIMVKRMSRPLLTPLGRRQILAWIDLMITAFGIASGDSWPEDDWKAILRDMLDAPQVFQVHMIRRVMKNVHSLNDEAKRSLRQLVDIARTDGMDRQTTVPSDKENTAGLLTVDDLKKLLDTDVTTSDWQSFVSDERDWVLQDEDDWRGVPLGLSPDQTAESLSLALHLSLDTLLNKSRTRGTVCKQRLEQDQMAEQKMDAAGGMNMDRDRTPIPQRQGSQTRNRLEQRGSLSKAKKRRRSVIVSGSVKRGRSVHSRLGLKQSDKGDVSVICLE